MGKVIWDRRHRGEDDDSPECPWCHRPLMYCSCRPKHTLN